MISRNLLNEKIILPFSDLILGQSISKDLKFLMRSQWWIREQIDEYQNYHLRKLIRYSYENVPYYLELFKKLKLSPDDIKSKNDLFKIPILIKEEIRSNFPDKFVARNLSKAKIILGSSSGSTGEPFKFYETKKIYSMHKAAGIRSLYWMNYRLGDKYIKISRRPRSSLIKKMQDFVNGCSYLFFDELTEEIFLKMIKKIESVDPVIIRCYPIPLFYMAEVIERHGGIKLKNLRGISTTASTLHPYMRNKIEQIFRVKIYDSCSCEGSALFAQCEQLNNYHPSEEYAISEFIEDDFSKNDKDHAKRHITTDLFNYATPFIRYDTQDYYVLGNKKCSCGRNFINILKIKGRDSDILVLPDGKFLIEEDFFQYFDSISTIKQFQVYQEKINMIHIRILVNDSYNDKVNKELYDYWQNYLGNDVSLSIDIVKKIELTPTGKRRVLVRNPKIKIS